MYKKGIKLLTNRIYLSIGTFLGFLIAMVFMPSVSYAQEIVTDSFTVSTTLGDLDSLSSVLFWIANLMKYLGWAGVVIGVITIIALLIYKLIASDDTETMKKVQGGITKAIIVVVLGLLLVSAGFLVTLIGGLIGAPDAPTLDITTAI